MTCCLPILSANLGPPPRILEQTHLIITFLERQRSESDEEVEPPCRKKARRLEKEIVRINAAVAMKEAAISKDIAMITERARIRKMSMDVEKERQHFEQEKLDYEVMMLDLSGFDEQEVLFWQKRREEILARMAARKVARAARVAAEQAAKEAAMLAELELERQEKMEGEGEREALQLAACATRSDETSSEIEEDEDGTSDVPRVDLTNVTNLNESDERERFAKICYDVADALGGKKRTGGDNSAMAE